MRFDDPLADGEAQARAGPLAGALADRIGARQTLIAALLVMAGAFALFPLIREAWHAFALNALAGVGSGAFWPSQGALLTGLTPRARRHAAFAQQRVTMNLGIGLGGLVGGLIATTSDPSSFTVPVPATSAPASTKLCTIRAAASSVAIGRPACCRSAVIRPHSCATSAEASFVSGVCIEVDGARCV